MKDELSIKVTIANRTYPLTIQRDEEEGVRKAVGVINDNIKGLESNYAVKDKQDLLAMTALEYVVKVLSEKENTAEDERVIEKLSEVESNLSSYLNQV